MFTRGETSKKVLFFRACGGPPMKVIIPEESRKAENPPLVKDQIEDKGGGVCSSWD